MRTTAHIIDAVEKLIKNMIPEIPISFVNAWESKSIFTIWRKSRRVFFYQSRQKNIVIDSNVNEVLERTLVAHELGHAVCKSFLNTNNRRCTDYVGQCPNKKCRRTGVCRFLH